VIGRRYCLAVIVSIWLLMALGGIAVYGLALVPFCAWGVLRVREGDQGSDQEAP
jgi:hypothetical protein